MHPVSTARIPLRRKLAKQYQPGPNEECPRQERHRPDSHDRKSRRKPCFRHCARPATGAIAAVETERTAERWRSSRGSADVMANRRNRGTGRLRRVMAKVEWIL